MPASHAKVLRAIAGLSDRRAGDGPLPLRRLREDPRRRPIVRQPALPELPARQGRGLARRSRPIACCRARISWSPSPCRPGCARSPARISGRSTGRCSGPRARRCAPGGRPEIPRHGPPGVLRRAAHLGSGAGVSPPCPLRRPRRRAQRRGRSLAGVAAGVPGAGAGAVGRLPGEVPRRCWQAAGLAGRGGPVGVGDATGSCIASRRATGVARCATWRLMCSGWRSATIGSCRATTAR